ncbi:MAG: YfiR family protein [Bdellovibrionota bacterium]
MGKTRIPWVLILILTATNIVHAAQAAPETNREYQIKAAFLYNFVKFTDWPGEPAADSNEPNTVDSNEPITIGIIGEDPFGNAFEPVKNERIKGRKIVLKRFKGLEESKQSSEQIENVKKCHLLFICRSQKEQLGEIIDVVKDRPVLTVADMGGFLESGGVINFILEEKKVRFEINLTAARHAGLRISSRLLRLAKRIVREKPFEGARK